MAIRVISGKAKGRKLKLVPGDTTRPVMDRVKESLFNILGEWVRGSRWLDLFAGTGSVGIEALSRGADSCVFFDLSREAIRTINDNLQITRLEEGAEVRRGDSLEFLAGLPDPATQFEVIYIAPPQYKSLWRKALETIDSRVDWLAPDGIAIVQIDPREYEDVPLVNLRRYDERKYGNTLLCFYERIEDDEADEIS
jgi:16S rRNA (guanine(966)-N(2))-methyltransferase RsmD